MNIKERGEETKPLSVYENGIIVFDDIVGSSSNRYIGQFLIRGRHKNFNNYYPSQSYWLTKKNYT